MVTPSKKIKSGQGILDELTSLWGLAERIEKESAKILAEDNPIMEQLGLVCVHLMNAHIEIEKLVSKSNNKFEPKSINQLLDLLTYIKAFGCKNWWDTASAYRKGVSNAAASYFVECATIRDLCTRRLHINTEKFLGLVYEWISQNCKVLQQLLKSHTYPNQHQKIDDFFNEERRLQ